VAVLAVLAVTLEIIPVFPEVLAAVDLLVMPL
jgi:hypothetical protein